MKKKLFGLILAVCLMISLLPMTTLAANPIPIRINQVNDPEGIPLDLRLDWEMMPGDVKYIVSADNIISEWKGTDAPADNFVKFEVNAAGDHLDVTMKNFKSIDTKSGDWSSHTIMFRSGDYSVTMNVVGENSITTCTTACISNESKGDFLLTGEGSLHLLITGQSSGGFVNRAGNLAIKDTTINFEQILDNWYDHHVIIMADTGNLLIENVKGTFNTTGGSAIYFSQVLDSDPGTSIRRNLYRETDRKLEIKNSELLIKKNDAGNNQGAIACVNTIVHDDCTVEIFSKGGFPFVKVPTFEGDEYTAIAGLKPATAKTYNPKKNAQFEYFKMTPGLPPETEPTTEPTTKPTEPATEPTIPVATEPNATQPNATQPNATQPNATQPNATEPNATQPNTGNSDNNEEQSGGNALTVVLIIVGTLVVVGGGAFAVLYILRKKGII